MSRQTVHSRCLTHQLANLTLDIYKCFLDIKWRVQAKVLEQYLVVLDYYEHEVLSVSSFTGRKRKWPNPLVVSKEWYCRGCGKQEVWKGEYKKRMAKFFRWFRRDYCSASCYNSASVTSVLHCKLCGKEFLVKGDSKELLFCARHAFWWRNL